jgi:hypothetical protein
VGDAAHGATHANRLEGGGSSSFSHSFLYHWLLFLRAREYNRQSRPFGSDLRQKFGLDSLTGTGVSSLQSHEALIGARVRVLETHRRPELRGMFGTIEHRFEHPEYLALDVRLDDGRLELFWAHGLESAEEGRRFSGPERWVAHLENTSQDPRS